MVASAGILFAPPCNGTLCAAQRTNVLWICADDHAAYVYGAYGNERVRTPRLDRLAAEGVRFSRAYCNSPVCTASRQSFLTGRYPHSVGVTLLKTALPESETTLAEMLRAAGYRTAAIGKMHFNHALTHGFETLIDLPDWQRALAGRQRSRFPRTSTCCRLGSLLPTRRASGSTAFAGRMGPRTRTWPELFSRPKPLGCWARRGRSHFF